MAVGDELLLGHTVDTNSAYLALGLARLGVPVVYARTVRDEDDEISSAVGDALDQADVVLVTGGLGPTPDDRTRDAVAALLHRPLHVDPTLLRALEARFRRRGFDRMPPTNTAQAQVPEGAVVLGNPIGTAPALALESEGRVVLLLPGVPREMKRIFVDLVLPYLTRSLGPRLSPIAHREIHTTGLPESELADRLAPLLDATGPTVSVAFLPEIAGVTLRISVRHRGDLDQAAMELDAVESALLTVVGPFIYKAPSGDLVEAVSQALLERGHTVATGESCTGGLVAKRLTDRAGSSRWFIGGVVAYANEAKTSGLDVTPETIATSGAVSEAVAIAMAQGAATRMGADCGIGITGVAGPEGGSADKPVGTVWIAVSVRDRVESRRVRFTGDREAIRERAAQASLALLLRTLREE